jgi:hypothetical protein
VALFTDRSAIGGIRKSDPSDELTNKFYVASGGDYYLHFERLGQWIKPLGESAPPTNLFGEVFRNSRFVLYKFYGAPDPTSKADTRKISHSDH